jgi:hypothetical protein
MKIKCVQNPSRKTQAEKPRNKKNCLTNMSFFLEERDERGKCIRLQMLWMAAKVFLQGSTALKSIFGAFATTSMRVSASAWVQ